MIFLLYLSFPIELNPMEANKPLIDARKQGASKATRMGALSSLTDDLLLETCMAVKKAYYPLKDGCVVIALQEIMASPTAQSFPNSQDLSCWRRKSFPTGKLCCRERNLRQQPKIQGLMAKFGCWRRGFFPNSIPVGKEKLLAKPQRGQMVPTSSASPTASPLAVGKGNSPSPTGLPCCWRRAFFPNSLIVLLARIALCQQHVHAVGKDFSIFVNFEFKFFW
jgi:hypothetical protein